MDDHFGASLTAIWLIAAFPFLLLACLVLLGRLERWVIAPDERAAEVARLLEQAERVEEVEAAVTRLLADVSMRHSARPSLRSVTRERLSAAAGRTRRRAPLEHVPGRRMR